MNTFKIDESDAWTVRAAKMEWNSACAPKMAGPTCIYKNIYIYISIFDISQTFQKFVVNKQIIRPTEIAALSCKSRWTNHSGKACRKQIRTRAKQREYLYKTVRITFANCWIIYFVHMLPLELKWLATQLIRKQQRLICRCRHN